MSSLSRDRAALLDALTAEIVQARLDAARSFYVIGDALARVQGDALWRDGGFESFEDYLGRAAGVSRPWAYRLMRIARHFNAEIAARYGVEKLDAALAYLAATPTDEAPGDLVASDVRVRSDGGRFALVPFHEATPRQIREAARLAREARRGGRSGAVSAAVAAKARELEAALPAAPKGLGGKERVRLSCGDDGRPALSFEAIPVDELDVFIAALQAARAGCGGG